MRKAVILSAVILVMMFAASAAFYGQLPDQIPSHWNAAGEGNGYMPKFWGLFLMPLITGGVILLFLVIPKIDPLKSNIRKFMGYFDGMIVTMAGFMAYLHALIILFSLGYTFNMTQLLIPAMGLLFIYIGFLLGKVKKNWFVGIRTPWTMSSDKVWDKTHKLGGTLFKASGIITLFGLVFTGYEIWFMIIPVIASAMYLVVYSYFEYRKQVNK